jgi:hypothetical protein
MAAPDTLNGSTRIDSADDFADTPVGWASRLAVEISAAKKEAKKWQRESRAIIKRFLDIRQDSQPSGGQRLNIFTSNMQTLRAIMYGRTPKADVRRRFDDSGDDVARVAGEMMERLINTDIEDDEDGYSTAIGHALDDWQLVGLGNVKVRYDAEFKSNPKTDAILDPQGEELAPEVPGEEVKESEDVDFDYVYWEDQLWSPSRTFGEVRWWAFRIYMTRDAVAKRFGKKVAKKLSYSNRGAKEDRDSTTGSDPMRADPWQRAEVWEIWSKEEEKVFWWSAGCDETLDIKDDPYELEGFWPFPRPMMANLTTTAFMPRPEFSLAKDLYNEIDFLTTRITMIERAVKVVGCYDASADGVRRLFTEGFDNDLIPVANWAMFADKGGLNGAISWMPLAEIIAALDKLREYRLELIKMTYEVTGMSDIMRGASESKETATAQAIKAKFGSVRMQAKQDEFARFCTDLLKLKAELIVKLFSDETIVKESNIQFTPDIDVAQQAIQMLRTEGVRFRLEVKPESISLTDYAALRQEKTEFIQSLTMFIQAMAPLQQAMPGSMPYALEMLKWTMAGFKGGTTIEGVLDKAIAAAQDQLQQPKPPPEPTPQEKAQTARAQADIQVSQSKAQVDIQTTQQKAQIDLQKNAMLAQQDMIAAQQKWRSESISKYGFDPVTGQQVGPRPAPAQSSPPPGH